jgi:hypothetical protein
MTIEQTVEIPASLASEGKRRLTIDVPPEVPAGRVVLTFTPAETAKPAAAGKGRLTQAQREAIENCRGLAKRLGSAATSSDFLEQRRKDHELEDRLDALHEEERRLDRARRQSGA